MANRDLAPWRGASTGWTPFDPFTSFRQEMDRLFDDFLSPATTRTAMPSGGNGNIRPSIDLKENDGAYVVTAELPGIDPKDVQVDLHDNVLAISGEKREEHNGGDNGLRYTERAFGRFERRIPLAMDVDADKVEAKFKNGVLVIEAPKNPKAQEKTRHIQVRTH